LEIQIILQKAQDQGNFNGLLKQLHKDFLRAGLEPDLDLGNTTTSVGRNIVAAIYALIISDFERYLSLLYIIDIDENVVKAIPAKRVDELAHDISVLILQRELKKVILKQG
jgi:hypothetical protein